MGDSYNNAVKAAKGFGHVTVIDSGFVSGGMALVVLAAARQITLGANVTDICELVDEMKKHISCSFMMSSITAFYKNGYTGKLSNLLCNTFRLRPIIKSKQSEFVLGGFKAGNKDVCTRKYIRSYAKRQKNYNHDIIYVTFAGIPVEDQDKLMKELEAFKNFKQVIVQKSSATNTCFAGRGTISVAVYVEK